MQATQKENMELSPSSAVRRVRKYEERIDGTSEITQYLPTVQVCAIYKKKLKVAGRGMPNLAIPDTWMPPDDVVRVHLAATKRHF